MRLCAWWIGGARLGGYQIASCCSATRGAPATVPCRRRRRSTLVPAATANRIHGTPSRRARSISWHGSIPARWAMAILTSIRCSSAARPPSDPRVSHASRHWGEPGFGAAITASVARRARLGHRHESGVRTPHLTDREFGEFGGRASRGRGYSSSVGAGSVSGSSSSQVASTAPREVVQRVVARFPGARPRRRTACRTGCLLPLPDRVSEVPVQGQQFDVRGAGGTDPGVADLRFELLEEPG